jgi:hypothetical protein
MTTEQTTILRRLDALIEEFDDFPGSAEEKAILTFHAGTLTMVADSLEANLRGIK